LSQGYYRWSLGPDEELMKLVDYVNIACGFHAGDHVTMLRTVRLAIKHNVGIGAHPGLDDLKGFGRRPLEITAEETYALAL
jgi:lactam utilization protein B